MKKDFVGIVKIVVVILVLAYLLYPKECGQWSTAAVSEEKRCTCLGVTDSFVQPIGGGTIHCFGICAVCNCYRHELVQESPGFVDTPMACN